MHTRGYAVIGWFGSGRKFRGFGGGVSSERCNAAVWLNKHLFALGEDSYFMGNEIESFNVRRSCGRR